MLVIRQVETIKGFLEYHVILREITIVTTSTLKQIPRWPKDRLAISGNFVITIIGVQW